MNPALHLIHFLMFFHRIWRFSKTYFFQLCSGRLVGNLHRLGVRFQSHLQSLKAFGAVKDGDAKTNELALLWHAAVKLIGCEVVVVGLETSH